MVCDMQGKKVVQTEVDMGTYARLKHLANRRSVPLKTVAREALRRFVDREEGDVETDPLFQLVGSLRLQGREWSKRKDWRS